LRPRGRCPIGQADRAVVRRLPTMVLAHKDCRSLAWLEPLEIFGWMSTSVAG
jgi:hypothetical protein